MTDDVFSKRGRALEDCFFAKQDEELLNRLRAESENQRIKTQLADVSGIRDDRVLDELVRSGVRPATFAALALAPLALVAWADDLIQSGERSQILRAIEDEGIRPEDPAYRLMSGWLDEKPDDCILQCWKAYIESLRRVYAPDSMDELRDRILGRARRVARAAGGVFRVQAISEREERILKEMESAFSA
ncbi:MAG: hypothetical protein FJ297_18955 [Planctomycetes bacterium]|nr:hypothetical protein [Planctomycetota bacterium]